MIKSELFYIGGQCQHSGQCCQGIMLYRNEKPINTVSFFEKIRVSLPVYKRFIPTLKPKSAQIDYYCCSFLTHDRRCSDYHRRPSFCQNYPQSSFMAFDRVRKGCGYKIIRTSLSPKIKNKTLRQLISSVIHHSERGFNL